MKRNSTLYRLMAGACLWLAVSSAATQKELEPLFGIVLNKGNIRIQVLSNGCTNADSFTLTLKDNELAIYRVKADHCRRGSFRVWVDFAEYRRIDGLKLLNPIKFFDKS
ncbi:MAG: hypothetical protein HRT35_01395 [Algicola sp.]|nr:hypothetical protein [Algicola sp.]